MAHVAHVAHVTWVRGSRMERGCAGRSEGVGFRPGGIEGAEVGLELGIYESMNL